ncbi:uncharacterized protein LOC115481856 [Microcaecilia unicolor]|uniref:Uncharacterized protein LOC115481856 n=1 Tax=Microcaecilia unicolor TaxID=1415580 RepID=A0A6P7ZGU4_9AMPH|nr:uncharacterized protein LOC115481856 [Microcaecilia unicolor]
MVSSGRKCELRVRGVYVGAGGEASTFHCRCRRRLNPDQNEVTVYEEKDVISKTLNNIDIDMQPKYCRTNLKQLYYSEVDVITLRDAVQMEITDKKITLDNHDVTTEKRDVCYQETLAITQDQKNDLNKDEKEILISEYKAMISQVQEIIPEQRCTLEDDQMFTIGQEHLMNYHQEDTFAYQRCNYIQKEAICDLNVVRNSEKRYTMNDEVNDFVSYSQKYDKSIPQLDSGKVVVETSVEKYCHAINLDYNLDFQKYHSSDKQKHKSSNKKDVHYDQIQILSNDMMY